MVEGPLESYQGDTGPQGQEEAPLQRISNFVCTSLMTNTKHKCMGQILTHAQKILSVLFKFE